MKLGIMVPRESDFDDGRDPYSRIYAYCERAEELGFDFCTFTHHRFSPERPYLSSPFVMMAAIAARTSALRLVTTVFVLPLYHPLDVAEAVGQLDHVSGGRVVLGVGAGYRQYEADAVGVPFHQRVSRMTESIEVLRAAWTHDTISFHGKHFDFDDVCVVPKPRQRPHPPIWIGALEAKPVARAGRIADGWIAPSLQTLDTLSTRAALYRDEAHGAGRVPVICLERDVVVATDGEAAPRGVDAAQPSVARVLPQPGREPPRLPRGSERARRVRRHRGGLRDRGQPRRLHRGDRSCPRCNGVRIPPADEPRRGAGVRTPRQLFDRDRRAGVVRTARPAGISLNG